MKYMCLKKRKYLKAKELRKFHCMNQDRHRGCKNLYIILGSRFIKWSRRWECG